MILVHAKRLAPRDAFDIVLGLPKRGTSKQRTEHLEVHEIPILLAWARENEPWTEGWFAVLLGSGARFGEAWRMKRAHVVDSIAFEGSERFITTEFKIAPRLGVGRTKTSKWRRIPAPGFAAGWLSRNTEKGEYLLPRTATEARTAKRLRRVLRRALEELGIRAPDPAGKIDFLVHDLRHTFAYLHASYGLRIEDLAELLGHASLETTRIYRGFVTSHVAGHTRRLTTEMARLAPTESKATP